MDQKDLFCTLKIDIAWGSLKIGRNSRKKLFFTHLFLKQKIFLSTKIQFQFTKLSIHDTYLFD